MKFLELGIGPTDRAIDPIDEVIGDHRAVHREALLHVDTQTDGTTVLLYRLSGAREELAADLQAHPYVTDQEVLDITREGFHAFVQTDTGDQGGALVELAHRHGLIIETPLEYVEGDVQATLVGLEENLRQALVSFPGDLEFSVENAGPYVPEEDTVLSPLTDRQREVFQTAVEEGYYEVPRSTTNEDIAELLDCAASTVDEHLRRAESRVVSGLLL